jgi:tRNA-splicing ligase RtcB
MSTDVKAQDVRLSELAHSISRDIPLGEGHGNVPVPDDELDFVLTDGVGALSEIAGCSNHRVWEVLDTDLLARESERIEQGGRMPGEPSAISDRARKRGLSQLATLGGGNHFIEMQRVEEVLDSATAEWLGLFTGQLVVMIHSGSRGLGHQVASDFMPVAEEATGDVSPNRDLCFLSADSDQGRRYIGAMNAGANFAFANRQLMMELVRRNMRRLISRDIRAELLYDVPHNMAKLEEHDGRSVWVHRKGATRAFGPRRMAGTPYGEIGQPVIIPGSMGTGSFLLVGVDDNEQTLGSVNHGAGRTMSRTAAAGKRRKGRVVKEGRISDDDFEKAMRGVELIAGDRHAVKEEAPQAYKDIDEVIRVVCGAGLARAVVRLKPLAVLKG